MVNVIVCLTFYFLLCLIVLKKIEFMEILLHAFSVLFLPQNNSLIECAKKGDLSGIEVALSRGADVNATDLVS